MSLRRSLPPLILLLAAAALLVLQHRPASLLPAPPIASPFLDHSDGSVPAVDRPPPARPAPAPAASPVDLGVTTAPLAADSARRWSTGDLGTVFAFERLARKRVTTVMWYADWRTELSLTQLRAVAAIGAVPEITWEPWDSRIPVRHPQPAYRLRGIVAGRYDAYITAWARQLATYGQPVLIRFAQEMDGNFYPWDEATNGNRPGEYVQAWRHVHHLFDLAHAGNVRWVWSPVFGARPDLYPGRDQVDVLGVTCLNSGTAAFTHRWRSFATVCAGPIAALHRLAPLKPIQISEAGSSERGGDKARWIGGMFAYLAAHPEVRAVIWFDLRKETDWRIGSSAGAARAFATGASPPRYR